MFLFLLTIASVVAFFRAGFGNKIIVTGDPRGRRETVVVVGTPKPGTIMDYVPNTVRSKGNHFSMEPAGTTAASGSRGMGADGDRNIALAVLLEDDKQGKTVSDAYVTGTLGEVYYPLPGEEVNLLKLDIAGTGDDVVIGDPLIVDDGTGQVVVSTGTPQAEPFIALENITDPTADTLIWSKRSGG